MSRPQVTISRLAPRPTLEPKESMNCKSCRKRKIKCNRMKPSCEACRVFQCACVYDAVPKKRGPKTDVLEALLKRVDGLERKLHDENHGNGDGNGDAVHVTTAPVTAAAAGHTDTSTGTASGMDYEVVSPDSERQSGGSGSKNNFLRKNAPSTNAGGDNTLDFCYTPVESTSTSFLPSSQPQSQSQSRHHQGNVHFRSLSSLSSSPSSLLFPFPPAMPQQSQIHYDTNTTTMVLPDSVLNTYFARLHGKPFFILDETAVKQCHRLGHLSGCFSMAIYAITLKYTCTSSSGVSESSLRMGLEYALQARRLVDIDNPSIEGLQTLLLLAQAFFAYGLGKKAYMTFSTGAAMVIALDLYREAPANVNISPADREIRRRLFWTAYTMDRFFSSGSKRPCLISDHSIVLRLPSSSSSTQSAGFDADGQLFNVGANIQYPSNSRHKDQSQGAAGLLIDIARILGITNRYLAAGGVKGDSHFPWHALSKLSKIRQELDIWTAGAQDAFSSIDALFGHPESTTLLLSKLIYHLVHCLIYRPFLPIDLVELRGTGQHQSWQIEATNLCFSHSNAITELVELGRNSPLIEWPDFVCFCVYVAGTVHVHGVHYRGAYEGEVFSCSAEFLVKVMNQLSWLRGYWMGVQHQREMLQAIYTCHSELVRTLGSSPMRYSPVFHLEDFLDRYPVLTADGGHVRLVDTMLVDIEYSDGYYNSNSRHDLFGRPSAPPPYPNLSPGMAMYPISDGYNSNNNANDNNLTSKMFGLYPTTTTTTTTTNNIQSPSIIPTQEADSMDIKQATSLQQQQHQHQHENNGVGNLFTPPILNLSTTYTPAFLSELVESASVSAPVSAFMNNINTNNVNPSTWSPNLQYATFPFDNNNNNNVPQTRRYRPNDEPDGNNNINSSTPSTTSGSSNSSISSSTSTEKEKDPFLSLLEQLVENEQNSQGGRGGGGGGGPSELDFYLGGGNGSGVIGTAGAGGEEVEREGVQNRTQEREQ